MYQHIATKTFRSYGTADQYIRDMYRKGYIVEDDMPRVVPVEASDKTPRYYSVMIRVHVADERSY